MNFKTTGSVYADLLSPPKPNALPGIVTTLLKTEKEEGGRVREEK